MAGVLHRRRDGGHVDSGGLIYRLHTGQGQALSTSVHQAVSQNTETDLPDWVYLKQVHRRVTCRHSTTSARSPSIALTKDGRYVLPYRTYVRSQGDEWDATVELLRKYGFQANLDDPKYATEYRDTDEARDRLAHQVDLLLGQTLFERDVWRDAQALNLPWTPVRRPEENVDDEHWLQRGAFFDVEHPELGRTFRYTGGKWLTEEFDWPRGPRPPLVGEHTDEVEAEWSREKVVHHPAYASPRTAEPVLSPHGKPFALSGVRVVDMSWMLASAGAGRFLAAMGADVVKIEHISRPDRMRFSPLGACPPGGRSERDAAVEALPTPAYTGDDGSPNRSGSFMEINSGKRSLSLNLKNPESRQILEDLIRDADMVIEGFSPGTMARMGLGYDKLRELNPRIIYVQQSGLGERGSYGQVRTFGPSAQAISGMSDMSGLPSPYPPAGIGYSYLDWFGAYNMATAIFAALYRRDVTGRGCHIDASQGETGLYLTGTAILDKTVNGRDWARYGNASPYKLAAPHGAFPTRGDDRWLALAAFTDADWYAVTEVLGMHALREDTRFTRLEDRVQHAVELERLLSEATRERDGFELMHELQGHGVAAGVCQTAEDRIETDPQLKALGWLVELEQSELGRWPVKEHPTLFSETPTYIGGRYDRSGPSYGEDTDQVLEELAGLDAERIAALRAGGAL